MDKARLNYLLDAVIGLAFALAGTTGIAFLVMGDGGYQGGRNPGFATSFLGLGRGTWSELHTIASLVMIGGVALHIAFHWRWILCLTKKMLTARPRPAAEPVCEVGA